MSRNRAFRLLRWSCDESTSTGKRRAKLVQFSGTSRRLFTIVVAFAFAAPASRAQLSAGTNTPPATLEDALHQMSDKADVIFAGQVIAIRQHDGQGVASGFVEVEFRVDQAVRGCTAGEPYILREWAGLWEGGATRYRVGERLLMFLHAPGPSGLSSPISGMDGAVPIHGSASTMVASATSAQTPLADLRWVNTHVLHPVSYRTASPHFDHRSGVVVPFLDPHPSVLAKAESAEREDVPMSSEAFRSHAITPPAPAHEAPVQSVIGMIRSWQKAPDAAR